MADSRSANKRRLATLDGGAFLFGDILDAIGDDEIEERKNLTPQELAAVQAGLDYEGIFPAEQRRFKEYLATSRNALRTYISVRCARCQFSRNLRVVTRIELPAPRLRSSLSR